MSKKKRTKGFYEEIRARKISKSEDGSSRNVNQILWQITFAAVNQVGEIKILVFLANEKSEKSHSKISTAKGKHETTIEIYEFQLKERD